MANKRYYHSEDIEFQNGDKTVAKQLTIKKLKVLTEIFNEHDKIQRANQRRVDEAVEAARQEAIKEKKPKPDEADIYFQVSEEIEAEGGKSYLDYLMEGTLVSIDTWGVKDKASKKVEVDLEYIEDNLDFPTMKRICEIAGSMELGGVGDDEGKEV